jgi:hypothetical protein
VQDERELVEHEGDSDPEDEGKPVEQAVRRLQCDLQDADDDEDDDTEHHVVDVQAARPELAEPPAHVGALEPGAQAHDEESRQQADQQEQQRFLAGVDLFA